jgi:hypothetical protein
LGDVAHDGAIAAVVGQLADGHEQRDEAPLRLPPDHFAPVVQHAGNAVVRKPVQIIARRPLALYSKQRDERLAGDLVAVEGK